MVLALSKQPPPPSWLDGKERMKEGVTLEYCRGGGSRPPSVIHQHRKETNQFFKDVFVVVGVFILLKTETQFVFKSTAIQTNCYNEMRPFSNPALLPRDQRELLRVPWSLF